MSGSALHRRLKTCAARNASKLLAAHRGNARRLGRRSLSRSPTQCPFRFPMVSHFHSDFSLIFIIYMNLHDMLCFRIYMFFSFRNFSHFFGCGICAVTPELRDLRASQKHLSIQCQISQYLSTFQQFSSSRKRRNLERFTVGLLSRMRA